MTRPSGGIDRKCLIGRDFLPMGCSPEAVLKVHVPVANRFFTSIEKPSMSSSYSVNGRSGHSVLEFPIRQSGRYAFACDYGESFKGPEVVVAVGSGVGDAIWRTVGGALVTIFGGIGAGLITVLLVVIMHEREKRRLRQPGQLQV